MSGRPGHVKESPRFFFETRRPAEEKNAFFLRLRNFAKQQGWARGISNEIELILEEWLADVISYGIAAVPDPLVKIEIFSSNRTASIIITDNGFPFDPTQQPPPDIEQPAEERPIGGLGIFMMRKLATSLRHERTNDRNILVIEKDLETPVLTKSV